MFMLTKNFMFGGKDNVIFWSYSTSNLFLYLFFLKTSVGNPLIGSEKKHKKMYIFFLLKLCTTGDTTAKNLPYSKGKQPGKFFFWLDGVATHVLGSTGLMFRQPEKFHNSKIVDKTASTVVHVEELKDILLLILNKISMKNSM